MFIGNGSPVNGCGLCWLIEVGIVLCWVVSTLFSLKLVT